MMMLSLLLLDSHIGWSDSMILVRIDRLGATTHTGDGGVTSTTSDSVLLITPLLLAVIHSGTAKSRQCG